MCCDPVLPNKASWLQDVTCHSSANTWNGKILLTMFVNDRVFVYPIHTKISAPLPQTSESTAANSPSSNRGLFVVICDVHATCKGHIGTKKTLAEVGKVYECSAKICHRQICVIVPCVSHAKAPNHSSSIKTYNDMVFSSYRTFCYYIKDVTVAQTIALYHLCTNQHSRLL